MEKQKEPVLPDMKPSPEDIELRKRQMQARRQAAQRAAVNKTTVAAAQPPKQTLAVVALVVALLLGGAAAFLFMQLQVVQKQLTQAQQVITEQGKNLQELNNKLSVTGENANLSVGALKVLLKENSSEIRKLWDVANKRNKTNIAANAKSIKAVKSSLTAANKSHNNAIAAVKNNLTESVAALSGQVKKVNAVEADVAAAQLSIGQNSEDLQTLEAKVSKIKMKGDIGDMKFEIEDLGIRLERVENALRGTAP